MAVSSPVHRLANFNAGPAVLPVEVLEELRENILSLGDSGIGVMEHSHRGKAYMAVHEAAERDCRELLGLTDDHAVLFLQGGASTQFYMIPWNFLQGGVADYIDTGVWSSKAIKEARAFGTVNVAASGKDGNYAAIPTSFKWSEGAKYAHYTSNNTIYGTEWRTEPVTSAPLICDTSSNMMSKPIDCSKYAMIYAGAQKNLGPSGVVLVIVRKDFAATGAATLPTMARYTTHIEEKSLYNTPSTIGIYIMGLVFKWMKKQGGLAAVQRTNEAKAKVLYDLLDSSDFWRAQAEKRDRSLMNIVWRLPNEELEAKLVKEAEKAGFAGLKGHRSAGGLRASTYNALPLAHVEDLVSFLREWEKKNG